MIRARNAYERTIIVSTRHWLFAEKWKLSKKLWEVEKELKFLECEE